jgi:inhibitor of cysteine peptidase
MRSLSTATLIAAALVGIVIGAGALTIASSPPAAGPSPHTPALPDPSSPSPPADSDRTELRQFDSRPAYRSYFKRARGGPSHQFERVRRARVGDVATTSPVATASADSAESGGGGSAPSRYSTTNVQEVGIDEPDILKTDGRSIFYGPEPRYHALAEWRRGGDDVIRPPDHRRNTTVLDASNPARPRVAGSVPASGDMLLVEDTLVVIGDRAIHGFDVSTPGEPERRWRSPLNESTRVVTARLLDGTVYLVTATGQRPGPCPIRPLDSAENAESSSLVIPCDTVYRPTRPADADVTYTTMSVDPQTGTVIDSVSVVGSTRRSATYVSNESVYLTYTRTLTWTELTTDFLLNEYRSELSQRAIDRVAYLDSLNISDEATAIELRRLLRNRVFTSEGEYEVYQNDFRAYVTDRKRDVTRTGIVEVRIDDDTGELSPGSAGEVPGIPLNQFSLDEHDDHLRIATTVGETFGAESANDLYVLNESLDITGSVTDMAPGQRIYAVRYMDDTAYVVTFRQVDPFHVVDLADPSAPEELGQVKLPGFSRYLHPVGDDRVIGIGQEDGRVKATLFDASTPADPRVVDDVKLDVRWSAVEQTHHAFVQDPKHETVFLPTGDGGTIIGYGDGLSVRTTVDTEGATTRSLYIDDYQYVFGQGNVVVVDQRNWSTVARVQLSERLPDGEADCVERDGVWVCREDS